MTCELCGKPGDTKRALVEGVEMLLCSNCAGYGKAIKVPPAALMKVRKPVQRVEPELSVVSNYSVLIRQARESKGMTQKEFAQQMAEKESVIQHLENGKLEPPLKLARKLEQRLSISLIEEVKAGTVPEATKSEGFTFGDLIKVRKR